VSDDEPASEGQPPGQRPGLDGVYSCADPDEREVGFQKAGAAIARSGLVVLPTDTVYGVAADAFDPVGVRRLIRAKGRSRAKPIPVLIGAPDTLRALTTGVPPEGQALADAFWPGGLTLICRQQPTLTWDLGDSRGTVGLRMPDQADALALLDENGPLAVSSANTRGKQPATTVHEAREMLADSVEIYLDAGPTPGPVPSTIVDATGPMLRVVRLGVVTLDDLREVVPDIEWVPPPEEG
jgi:L-threonylcarbamoyladenylate synthase